MKVGRRLWIVLVVVFVVCAVVANLDNLRRLPASFLKSSLISQIIIGFVVWLISLIVGFIIFGYWLDYQAKRGAEVWFGWLSLYLIFWPPAWPITVILLLVIGIMRVLRKADD